MVMKVLKRTGEVNINGAAEGYSIEIRFNQYSDSDLRYSMKSEIIHKIKRWHLILVKHDNSKLKIERRALNANLVDESRKAEIEFRDSLSLHFNNEIVEDKMVISKLLHEESFALVDITKKELQSYESDVVNYDYKEID